MTFKRHINVSSERIFKYSVLNFMRSTVVPQSPLELKSLQIRDTREVVSREMCESPCSSELNRI